MQLTGRRVLLTGADGGIGQVVAELLCAHGAQPVLTGQQPKRLAAVAGRLGLPGLPWELSSARDGYDLGRRVLADGPMDGVVHVAGVGHRGPVDAADPLAVDEMLGIDLAAPIGLTSALLPGMLARGGGHVCFVGSIAGMVAVAEESAYAAAKGGLAVFADSLRLEVAPRGVEVSLVAPAAVATEFFARRGAAYHRRRPRPMDPARVAEAIVRAVESGGPRVVVPGWMEVAVRLRGVAPRLYDRLVTRFDG